MITFTKEAEQHIKEQVHKESGKHFRLWVKSTGCSGFMYMPEIINEPKDDDIEVGQIDDVKIFLDPKAEEIVRGTEVDYVEKMLGFKQMVFSNPNVTGLCGCGESFKLKSESEHGG